MHRLTIVTLGSGDESLLTRQAEQTLRGASRLILRTERHPVAEWLRKEGISFSSLDGLYEKDEDFDLLNEECAKAVLKSCEAGDTCYAVSDTLTDATVAALRDTLKDELQILPGISQAERCIALLGITSGAIRLCSASDFLRLRITPGEPLLLTELFSKECAGECKLKLLRLMPEEMSVQLITGTEATGKLKKTVVPLYELDRQKKYDHLTAAYLAPVDYLHRERYDMDDVAEVVRRLRAPDGCPWDREQTHETLLSDLLEESWEYIETVREGDTDAMYDELGDVLFQVAMHTAIGEQFGEFEPEDVTTAICRKMIERHPHVFGSVSADTTEQVLDNWEAQKRAKRNLATVTDAMRNVSKGLSALLRARKVQHKAHKVGFDFADAAEALTKVSEEAGEVAENLRDRRDPQEELGDLLFSVVNVCRLANVEPDLALHFATEKFIRRFEKLENAILADGKHMEDLTLAQMDEYWNAGKKEEQK